MTGGRRASISAIARRAARRARRRAPTSPIGRMRSAPGSNCARAAGCGKSPPTSTAWPRARSITMPMGSERFQPAEVVIVACNGIGTPRLLLNSASGRFPNGLANSSGLVGKNLMLHPWPQVRGYVDEQVDGDRAPMLSLWSKEFYETDPSRDFVRGYTLQFARGTGPVNEAITSEAAGPALGRGPSPRLSPIALPAPADRHRLRGPAGGAQPGDARPGAEGQPRHSGAEGSTTPSARTRGA
jgi:hypothetical protein